jgi:endonuclease III
VDCDGQERTSELVGRVQVGGDWTDVDRGGHAPPRQVRLGPRAGTPSAEVRGQGQPLHTPLEAFPSARPSPLAMVQPLTGKQLLDALRSMLRTTIPDLDAVLDQFGQVGSVERRAAGGRFTLKDHVKGLLLALLSNQRPWLPIARAMEQIEEALLGFDPDDLERADPLELTARLVELRCGNRAVAKQMRDLARNIATLRRIEAEHGSLDAFVTSAEPELIARQLSDSRSPYKVMQLGFTLATEYLRNVGISTAKPDLHVQRILGPERLGVFPDGTSLEGMVQILATMAGDAGVSTSELDTLVWLFGAKGYGEICTASPACDRCMLAVRCERGHAQAS